MRAAACFLNGLQGFPVHKETSTPLGLSRHRPTVGSWGGTFSYSEVPLYTPVQRTYCKGR